MAGAVAPRAQAQVLADILDGARALHPVARRLRRRRGARARGRRRRRRRQRRAVAGLRLDSASEEEQERWEDCCGLIFFFWLDYIA